MTAIRSRRHAAGALAILSALAITATACGSSKAAVTTTAAPAATTAAAAVTTAGAATTAAPATTAAAATTAAPATTVKADPLGTPKKATGSPIKIGFVGDGKSDAIDNSQGIRAAQAAAKYANEYQDGLNGHVIEVDVCETKQTPTGATTCGVQMVADKVAAVLVGGSGQDGAIFEALKGSGIPYFTTTSATGAILGTPGAYIMTNPLGSIGAPAIIGKSKKVDKAGIIVIDVPAATGPIGALAKPAYAANGIELQMIPISATVADMTPQVQDAISKGNKQFSVVGTESFVVNGIKALKQLGFKGDIISGVNSFSADALAAIPGGVEGVLTLSSSVTDPADKEVIQFNAVIDKFGVAGPTAKDISGQGGYVAMTGFLRALAGATAAVDAASITTALNTMTKPVALPIGGGIMFQCGTKPVAATPNVCTSSVLVATFDKAGKAVGAKPLETAAPAAAAPAPAAGDDPLAKLSAGAKQVASSVTALGLPAKVAACVGQTTYDGLTADEKAELDKGAADGKAPAGALADKTKALGTAAFGKCSAG